MGVSSFAGVSPFDSKAEIAGMSLAFVLSLSLFGLTTLEALPLSTQTSLSQQASLAFFYWIILWLLSIYIILVVPSLVGASVAASFGHFLCCRSSPTNPDSKEYKDSIFDWRNLPWYIRFPCRMAFGLVMVLVKKVFSIGRSCCCSSRRRQNPIDSSVLPLREESAARSLPEESREDSRQQRFFAAIGGICGIVLVIGIISTIGPLVVQLPPAENPSILSLIVSWLCGIGLLISSVMNGFGSVSLPYTTLSGFFLHQIPPECITKLESDLQRMRNVLIEKQEELREMKVHIPINTTSRSTNRSSLQGPSGKTFSMSVQKNTNSGFSDLRVELKKRREILNSEIGFMEDLIRETSLDLDELKHSQVVAATARTSVGKSKLYVGLVFSSILLIRLFNAGYSVLRSHSAARLERDYTPRLHKKSRSDIVTTILLWLSGHHHLSYDQHTMLSQMISLVLSAILSFSQITTFLRTAKTVHRRLSRLYNNFFCPCDKANGIGSLSKNDLDEKQPIANFLWRIISAFLGCYSLACIVLIKMMLPEIFSVAFSMALDETSIFTIRSSAVDTVFLSSAAISSSVFGILLGIQRQNISKHANTQSRGGSNFSLPDV